MTRYSLLFALLCAIPAWGEEPPPLVCGVLEAQALLSPEARDLAAAPLNAIGEKRIAIVLLSPADNPGQPHTPQYAKQIVSGPASDFMRENSQGRTWLTADAFGWLPIPAQGNVCDPWKISSQGKQAAAAAGLDLSRYTNVMWSFPKGACPWWGLAMVGGGESWINGLFAATVVAHELGHNLGLYHANALECGATVTGTNCQMIEYGDCCDTMGRGAVGHFNAFHKERLGWLKVQEVTGPGVYEIAPYENQSTEKPQAISVKGIDGSRYLIERRMPIGADGWLAVHPGVVSGVVVHAAEYAPFAGNSLLLDLTPGTPSWLDPALLVGQTFRDKGVQITLLSANANGATVQVGGGVTPPPPPVVVPPPVVPPVVTPPPPQPPASGLSLALQTDKASYTLGQSIVLTATVKRNGQPVRGARVRFVVTRPDGVKVTRNHSTGPNGQVIGRVGLSKSFPVGTYSAHIEVSGQVGAALQFEVKK